MSSLISFVATLVAGGVIGASVAGSLENGIWNVGVLIYFLLAWAIVLVAAKLL